MPLVEPDDLPDAEDLWWSWVVLAALHRAGDHGACRFDARDLVLTLDGTDGSWLRMQRPHGSRSVLWGRSALATDSPADARGGVPDWALSDAVLARAPAFVAWHAHGEWDASAPDLDEGALQLLRPILTMDPRVVELGRSGRLTAEVLAAHAHGEALDEAAALVRRAAGQASAIPQGSVRTRLRDQVHDQMRDAAETDRMLLQRPPDLVRWWRVHGPSVPFEHAVTVTRTGLTASRLNTRIPDLAVQSLSNVLQALHHEEASETSGAWVFGRVSSDGATVRLDRAFDSWPEWYQVRHASQGPSLEDLAWEMAQRTPAWQPAWAALLPRI